METIKAVERKQALANQQLELRNTELISENLLRNAMELELIENILNTVFKEMAVETELFHLCYASHPEEKP